MERHGVSARRLSEMAGLNVNFINQMFKRSSSPSIENASQIRTVIFDLDSQK